jgi:uncharacterized protein YqjF (DUF2071 family)
MRIPTLQGIIRRRILVNYRVEPDAIRRILPPVFRPKLHKGKAIAGICLIRLEHIRPKFVPEIIGVSSENAAHRIAVLWEDETGAAREGVYIPRRDTNSLINTAVGGRLFPGEHHRANFAVREEADAIRFEMRSQDKSVSVELKGRISEALPEDSVFSSLSEASGFFETGSLGYSAASDARHLDGIVLQTKEWKVEPLALDFVHSSFYADESAFPKGSVEFDHALIMQNIEHEWHGTENFNLT